MFAILIAIAQPDFPALRPSIRLGLHRGGTIEWPENTAFGFKEAAELHPDLLLETDVTATKDGVSVLLHDETVDRTTDGTGRIAEMTYAEVQKLDAAAKYRNGELRGKNIKIPTLAEALRAAPKHRFMIDLKPASNPDKVIEIIRQERAESRVILASFIPAHIQKARKLAPKIPTCYDSQQGTRLLFALRSPRWNDYKPEAPILSLMKEHIDQYKIKPEEILKIQAKGILLHLHTLDSLKEVKEWEAKGVGAWLTDDPAVIRRAISSASE